MGWLSKIKRGQFLKRVGNGLLDVLGKGTIKANKEDNHKIDENGNPVGSGQIDWVRLGTFVTMVMIAVVIIISTIALLTGAISFEQFIEIVNKFK